MRIYSPSAGDENTLVVRWLLNGVEDFAYAIPSEGVVVPEGAELLDIALSENIEQTIHLIFDPAHAEHFAVAA